MSVSRDGMIVSTSVGLELRQLDELDKLTRATGLSRGEIVREAVEQVLEQYRQKGVIPRQGPDQDPAKALAR